MANSFYTDFFDQLGSAGIAFLTDNIKVVLTDADYTFSAAHTALSDIGGTGRVATSGNLSGKTLTDGVFDADDITFAAVAAGDTVTGFALYKDTGVESTSTLIAFWDTDTGGAISIPTNGGDINLTWDSGANKILSLYS